MLSMALDHLLLRNFDFRIIRNRTTLCLQDEPYLDSAHSSMKLLLDVANIVPEIL